MPVVPEKNIIRSVDRTIDVLKTFVEATGGLKVSEIEAATGINLPTLYRIIKTLERRHFIRATIDPTRYELDYGIIEIASGWLRNQDVVGKVEPLLQGLAHECQETVALNLTRKDKRVCVREIPSQKGINFTRGVGTTESLLYGASGKVILAFSSTGLQIELMKTFNSAKRKKYLLELNSIQHLGYSTSASELIQGATSIAAPIWDLSNAILGSVGIYGPTTRISDSKLTIYKKLIKVCGVRMSAILGYSGN